MYKHFNITYDKDALAALAEKYKDAPKLVKGQYQSLDTVIYKEPAVEYILKKFSFMSAVHHHFSLTAITDTTVPYINPGNNGMIILPVNNDCSVSFYSYRPPIKNNRPYLDPTEVTRNADLRNSILPTKTQTILIDRPTAINGLKVHSVDVNPATPSLVFIIRIPIEMTWDTLDYLLDDVS